MVMKLRSIIAGGLVKISGVLDAPYSTVVILEDENEGIVVIDPGSSVILGKLERELESMGLKPDDVKHIILTHFHMDHAFNTIFFESATIHLHSAYSTKDYSKFGILLGKHYEIVRKSWRRIETFEDGDVLFESIEIHSSPWHAREHVSMVLNLKDGRYFVVGDVCPTRLDYYDIVRKRRNDEIAEFVRKFSKSCDVVIFPHDEPLRIQRGGSG